MRKKSSKKPTANGSQLAEPKPKPADPGVTIPQAGSVLLDYSAILSLVLGGCCANVWSYEQLLIMNPRIGSALTFSQMMFITLQSLPNFLTFESNSKPSRRWLPTLKPRQVPLSQWASQVLVHTTGSLLNNWAFAFNVPLTVLIVFRSAGLAVSMVLGFFILGRRYSILQVASVLTVSVGAILATLSKTTETTTSSSSSTPPIDLQRYTLGIAMVLTSLLLTGILGVLQEQTYKKYGPCWKEGVFYMHVLSLPVFLFLAQDVRQGLASLNHPSDTSSGSALTSWLILAGNLITQLVCVSGVNRLTSRVSSVSTNLVLTTRKAISLCFSVWWFGSGWNLELAMGAGMVFLGSLVFSIGGSASTKSAGSGGESGSVRRSSRQSKEKEKEE
ncbi:UAA transporter [Gymnopus androsaceus JB14]|uniref:UAA transporter n=1 Tax=Gymnopus androsaceus JB14 TaxID=1447944 RepID=A0A6A4IA39_9AGAR|nr:UAA transporter [Gymnopus androsaceus JB14]